MSLQINFILRFRKLIHAEIAERKSELEEKRNFIDQKFKQQFR